MGTWVIKVLGYLTYSDLGFFDKVGNRGIWLIRV